MPHEPVALRSGYFRAMADRSRERLRQARIAAGHCRNSEAVHRLAMKAVFALEDTLFALEQIARSDEGSDRDLLLSCEAHRADDAA